MEARLTRRLRAMGWGIFAVAALAILGSSGSALGQGAPQTPQPPGRIGNRADHKDFQPNAAEVCADARADTVNCSSRAGTQADETLKKVQSDLDELNKKYPPGRPLNGTSSR